MGHISRELIETEILSDSRHGTPDGVLLKPAYQHLPGVFFEINSFVEVTHHGSAGQVLDFFGYNIIMFTGIKRQLDANGIRYFT